MFTNAKITVISAHPDDLEIGMGQYLLELLRPERRNLVSLCVVTEGGAGGFAKVRRKEQREGVRFLTRQFPQTFAGLHAKSYAFHDTELTTDKKLISYLETICAGSDVVFTQYPEDSHQDHRALGVCTRPACRHVSNVLFYQSYTAIDFQPSLFYDFTPEELKDGKLRLIQFHKSQIGRYSGTNQDLLHDMHALAAYNGFLMKSPKKYAEGFVPWKVALARSGFITACG
jgi:LmbE family N-acetylglucosaminyl deacetylase